MTTPNASKQDSTIQALAKQYATSESVIKELYEAELNKLQSNAQIKTFLPVLATRHVKESLTQATKTQTNT